jgi:hypothetical protein
VLSRTGSVDAIDGVLAEQFAHDGNANRQTTFAPSTGTVDGTYDDQDRLPFQLTGGAAGARNVVPGWAFGAVVSVSRTLAPHAALRFGAIALVGAAVGLCPK